MKFFFPLPTIFVKCKIIEITQFTKISSVTLQKMYSEIPQRVAGYDDQTQLTPINDDEFDNLFKPNNYTKFQKFYQIFCFFLFLGPIKIIFASVFFTAFFILVLILPLVRPFFPNNNTFKLFCHTILQPTVRLMFYGMGFLRIKVNGTMHPECRFIVANNLTLVDSILLFTLFPMSLVCNEKLTTNYFVRKIRYVLDLIFVDTKKTSSITQALYEYASDPSFLPVVVFPEFKPTNGNAILKFEPVAFASEYYVQPVTIRYKLWLTPKNWNSMCELHKTCVENLWGFFSTPWITVDVSFLNPQFWKESDAVHPKKRASQTQLLIANTLSVPAVDRSGSYVWNPKAKND